MHSVTSAELKRHALALPPQQRIELIDALLEEGLPPLTDAQKRLIEERWAAYEANPDDMFAAEDVHVEAITRRE